METSGKLIKTFNLVKLLIKNSAKIVDNRAIGGLLGKIEG